MSDAYVWVKNNDNTSFLVKANKKAKDGTVEGEVTATFRRQSTDRQTGAVISNGYTRILKDEYDVLYAESKLFKSMVDKGALTVFESEPDEASSPIERVAALTERVGVLSAALSESKESVNVLTNELVAAREKIASLEKALSGGEFDTGAAAKETAKASKNAKAAVPEQAQ